MIISIKKYWKIIVTAFTCIIVILLLSYASFMGKIAFLTVSANSTQKGQITENVEASIRFYENRINIIHKAKLDVLNKLSNIIYGKDAGGEEKLLNEYLSDAGIEDLIILDSERSVINTYGGSDYTLPESHFNDPYYDAIFADADTKGVNAINILALKEYGKDALFIKVRDGYWVYIFPALKVGNSDDIRYFWETTLENIWVGDYSDIGVTDISSGKIIYCWDDTLEGQILEIKNTNSYWGRINGDLYYVSIYPLEDMSVNVVSLTSIFEVIDIIKGQLISIAVLIFAAITIMIALVIFLREDEIDAREEIHLRGKYFIKSQLEKYSVVGLVVTLVLAGSLVLVSEVEYMTNLEKDMSSQIEKTQKLFDDYYYDSIEIDNTINSKYYAYGRIADTYLKHHPDYATKKGLRYLAEQLGVSDISLFNSQGKSICTSSSLDHLSVLSDKTSPLYDLQYVLMGKDEATVSADARIMPENISIFAIPSRNDKGIAEGMVAIETVKEEVKRLEPKGLLEDKSGSIQFCVDKEGTILIFHDNKMVGKNVSSIGIPQDLLYDGYSGKYEYELQDYAALVRSSKAGYTVLVSKYESFSPNIMGVGILSSILFVISAMIFAYDGLGSKYKFSERPLEKKSADDSGKKTEIWAGLDAGTKMKSVINFYIFCFSAYFIISQWLIYIGVGDHNTINYIFNGDWHRSVNIFSIVCNIFTIMIYYSVINWLSSILTRAAIISGPSGETISRLIANIIKYLGAIICTYQVTMNFGVDTKTALTSMGIVGFGLTFGAQDMIKDIIAGIFIFFEGIYKVGDQLLINGDSYEVKSIGIRATQVESSGQVRVINNSQMSGAINIQDKHSSVNCDVYIGNEYDLDDVEEILAYELPLLSSKYPPDVPTPRYKGVQEIDANGIKIRISTNTSDNEKGKTGMLLRRDVLRILSKYNIRIAPRSYEIIGPDMMATEWGNDKKSKAEALSEAAETIRKEKKD